MSQSRIHDYHSPRSTADLNKKFVGLITPGVYQGFHISNTGLLSPGILITAEGVRIEETGTTQLLILPNISLQPRRDIVICDHEYLQTVPVPPAIFRVVTGTPGATAPLPTIPAHATLIAVCHIVAGGITWDQIEQNANPPERLCNAVRDGWDYKIVKGGYAASLVKTTLGPGSGSVEYYIHPGTGLADNAVIPWGSPVFTFTSQGTPAGIIRLADSDSRFAGDTVEAALAELAGAGRTTQTVKGTADALSQETTNRQTADSNLQTQMNNHQSSTSAHNASAIPIVDSGNRYTGTNVETALQEIAGAGRTTETVKNLSDGLGSHTGATTDAHDASAISTEAVAGSPFSLTASQMQSVITAVVGALNARALKAGDTFTGPVTFQGKTTHTDIDFSGTIKRMTPKLLTRVIPACAAESDTLDIGGSTFMDGWRFNSDTSEGRIHWACYIGTVATAWLSYPIVLPPGVRIKSWEVGVKLGGDSIRAVLRKERISDGYQTAVGTLQELTSGTTWTTLGQTGLNETVDAAYAYSIRVDSDAGGGAGKTGVAKVTFEGDEVLE